MPFFKCLCKYIIARVKQQQFINMTTYLRLARTMYIRCTHGIFGRKITKHTVIR